ncbi:MAG TPA: alkaline phosphatase family protein, partial [Actinomycetota bacterium]|nr:alkaline phosphatase family protein [Actinomycetota bacterium]
MGARSARRVEWWLCLFSVSLVVVACQSGNNVKQQSDNAHVTSSATVGSAGSPSAKADQLELARQHIKHIVFIIKENRTFDHMFGRMHGVDGATSGVTCDGKRVPLKRAP